MNLATMIQIHEALPAMPFLLVMNNPAAS